MERGLKNILGEKDLIVVVLLRGGNTLGEY